MHLRHAAALALVGCVVTFVIYSDYHWAQVQIAKASASGWQVAAKSDNFIDLERPWTIFKQPINALWFVKPSDTVLFTSLEHRDGTLCAKLSTMSELTKPNGPICGVRAHIVIATLGVDPPMKARSQGQ